jgi:SpoVK/Ycf46/Vps4 family AAA+-type ATPase
VNALLDELSLLVRARYPLVMLLTHEEARAERALDKLCEQRHLDQWRWSRTEGLVDPSGARVPDTLEPAAALGALAAHTAPGLFRLVDLHPFLDDPVVVRRLRDLAARMGGRKQAAVLLSPELQVPPELGKDLVVIDLPLPDRDEVGRILRVLLKARKIDLPGDRFDRFVRGSLGLTENEIKRLYARILLSGGTFTDTDLRSLVAEKRRVIRRSRFLEFHEASERIADVGGMDSLKEWLRQRQAGFSRRARDFGLPEPKGVFLLGVQGCGKSLMAKAVADLWQLPLLRLDVAALFQSGGSEEQGLRETVRIAETLAPAVLWIDEIEKGFSGRGDAGGEGFGYFLTWMQEKKKPVFVVSTANDVRFLPPELLRKGRFDEIFFVDLPSDHERLSILEIHLRRRGRDPDLYDLVQVSEETDRFSGAELEQVVVGALFAAFAEGRSLTTGDLLDTCRELIPLAVTMDDRLKELREWARPRARKASNDRRRIDFFEDWDADVA